MSPQRNADDLPWATEVSVSSKVFRLRAPATEDTLELAGLAACRDAEAIFGESGACRYRTATDWQEYEDMLRFDDAPEGYIASSRVQWMAVMEDRPYAIGVIHLWCPAGTAVAPEDFVVDVTRRDRPSQQQTGRLH